RDGAPFAACTSPKAYDNLTGGPHTFEVRAIDNLGVEDPTPATLAWIVDATKPVISITGGPAEGSTSCSAVTFTYACNEPSSTVQCERDGAQFQPCGATSQSYSNLSGGPHSWSARCAEPAATIPTPQPRARRGVGGSRALWRRRPPARCGEHEPRPERDDRPVSQRQVQLDQDRLDVRMQRGQCARDAVRQSAELERPDRWNTHVHGRGYG